MKGPGGWSGEGRVSLQSIVGSPAQRLPPRRSPGPVRSRPLFLSGSAFVPGWQPPRPLHTRSLPLAPGVGRPRRAVTQTLCGLPRPQGTPPQPQALCSLKGGCEVGSAAHRRASGAAPNAPQSPSPRGCTRTPISGSPLSSWLPHESPPTRAGGNSGDGEGTVPHTRNCGCVGAERSLVGLSCPCRNF